MDSRVGEILDYEVAIPRWQAWPSTAAWMVFAWICCVALISCGCSAASVRWIRHLEGIPAGLYGGPNMARYTSWVEDWPMEFCGWTYLVTAGVLIANVVIGRRKRWLLFLPLMLLGWLFVAMFVFERGNALMP